MLAAVVAPLTGDLEPSSAGDETELDRVAGAREGLDGASSSATAEGDGFFRPNENHSFTVFFFFFSCCVPSVVVGEMSVATAGGEVEEEGAAGGEARSGAGDCEAAVEGASLAPLRLARSSTADVSSLVATAAAARISGGGGSGRAVRCWYLGT